MKYRIEIDNTISDAFDTLEEAQAEAKAQGNAIIYKDPTECGLELIRLEETTIEEAYAGYNPYKFMG